MRIILSALWGWNLGLALCFVLLAIGCSRTESITPVIPTITPIPTPVPTLLPTPILAPTQVVIVNERDDVMESLILFNDTNNNFIRFMHTIYKETICEKFKIRNKWKKYIFGYIRLLKIRIVI